LVATFTISVFVFILYPSFCYKDIGLPEGDLFRLAQTLPEFLRLLPKDAF